MTLHPDAPPARVSQRPQPNVRIPLFGGIDIYAMRFGEIKNLPEPEDGVMLIVSRMLRQAAGPEREDLLVPGRIVSNEFGDILHCVGLAWE